MGQIIISVGREFGSGGRVIAEALAERFNIPIYDRHLITDIAEKTGLTPRRSKSTTRIPSTEYGHVLSAATATQSRIISLRCSSR